MLPANRFAFKEWAVVCAALAAGRQSLILRKGGIHEGHEGFRVAHREFWLFPTRFHQQPDELTEEARPLLEQVRQDGPPAGTIRLDAYAVVEEVRHIADESLLPRLEGLHVWSERTLAERFHYRSPGLFALTVRAYRATPPVELPDSPHFAGCRSWVDFPTELSTEGLIPVLTEAEFDQARQTIARALTPARLA